MQVSQCSLNFLPNSSDTPPSSVSCIPSCLTVLMTSCHPLKESFENQVLCSLFKYWKMFFKDRVNDVRDWLGYDITCIVQKFMVDAIRSRGTPVVQGFQRFLNFCFFDW